jgi:hypothetical protein
MKKIVFITTLFCTFCSCVNIGSVLVNEEGRTYDVRESIAIPDSMFRTKLFYRSDIEGYDTISGKVVVEFGSLSAGFQDLYSDSLPTGTYSLYPKTYSSHPRFKYAFSIPTPVLPYIKLNSFSFTDKDGSTIPCILYYKTDNKNDSVIKYITGTVYDLYETIYYNTAYTTFATIINIIDSFPAIFTNDIKSDRMFEIYAECSQSYRETKLIYVNYDIEIGNKRYIKHVKYESKWHLDIRPKLW